MRHRIYIEEGKNKKMQSTKIVKIQSDLEDAKRSALHSVANLMERGQKIEKLEHVSDDLNNESDALKNETYYYTTTPVQRAFKCLFCIFTTRPFRYTQTVLYSIFITAPKNFYDILRNTRTRALPPTKKFAHRRT